MSFFPPDAPAPEYEEPERNPRWSAPDDEIAVTIGRALVLARTDHVAVAFRGADVYRDGVELRIDRMLRRGEMSSAEWATIGSRFMEHAPGEAGERLMYGIILSDGTRLIDRPGHVDDAAGPSLTRTGGSGGGGGRFYATHDALWLHPLPPPGPIEFVLRWPLFGIAETRVAIDLGDVRAAAGGVVPVWD